MSRATITLEDDGEGQFRLSTNFEGGYQIGSMAHEAVVMITKFMDSIAEQRSRVEVHGDDNGELTKVMGGDPAANAELQAALTTMRAQADAKREAEVAWVAANGVMAGESAPQVAIATESDAARLAVRAQG